MDERDGGPGRLLPDLAPNRGAVALLLMILGALAIVAGTALLSWKAAVLIGGVILVLAGADLARTDRETSP